MAFTDVKHASVNLTIPIGSPGVLETDLVGAVAGRKIVVVYLRLHFFAASKLQLKSGATAITPQFGSGLISTPNPLIDGSSLGVFRTADGEALVIRAESNSAMGGEVQGYLSYYVE